MRLPFLPPTSKNVPKLAARPDAYGRNVAFDVLYRIVNRKSRRDRTAVTVDIQLNFLLRVGGFQELHLGNDETSRRVAHFFVYVCFDIIRGFLAIVLFFILRSSLLYTKYREHSSRSTFAARRTSKLDWRACAHYNTNPGGES